MLASVLLVALVQWQIVLIVAVLLLLFGGRKIPELMKGLGKGMKEFKDAKEGNDSNSEKTSDTDSKDAKDKLES